MPKLPKITIKFILNKKLAPIEEDNVKKYPLYILITFQRQTTQLKSRFGDYYESIDIVKALYPDIISVEERIIRKTIEREVYLKDDKFNLKGLSELYDRYSTSIWGMVSARLKEWLKTEMYAVDERMAKVPNYDHPELFVQTLRLAAIRLIPGFDQVMSDYLKEELNAFSKYMAMFPLTGFDMPMTIESENGEHRKEIKAKYKEIYGDNPTELSCLLGMIDKSIY